MSKSKIIWTERTLEVTGGCTACSPGCLNCYGKNYIWRWAHKKVFGDKYKGLVKKVNGRLEWTGKIKLFEDALEKPLSRKKPTIYFVDSRSDLFHPKVPFDFIDSVAMVIGLATQHTYQLLTKRPGRALAYRNRFVNRTVGNNIFQNHVHLGVSICTPDELHKADTLREIPVAVKFISFEPLLADMGEFDLTGIDWVIVGAESPQPKMRWCPTYWISSIVRQCKAAGVPVIVKQVHLGTPEKFRLSKKIAEWPCGLRVQEKI